ncbi:D-aminoacyl-tRNA deacylase, partial [Phenoliferia sp. Uapishka_3]
MRAVIQRCTSASVTVSSTQISSIGRGLMVLVGIGTADTEQDLGWLVGKILALRLFPNEEDAESSWKRSVVEAGAEVLCASLESDEHALIPNHLPLLTLSFASTAFSMIIHKAKSKCSSIRQFTLMATTKKSKPDFREAMTSEKSRLMYDDFLVEMGKQYDPARIKNGQGPVTILLDSRDAGSSAVAQGPALDLKKKRKEDWEAKAKANTEKARAFQAEKSVVDVNGAKPLLEEATISS